MTGDSVTLISHASDISHPYAAVCAFCRVVMIVSEIETYHVSAFNDRCKHSAVQRARPDAFRKVSDHLRFFRIVPDYLCLVGTAMGEHDSGSLAVDLFDRR